MFGNDFFKILEFVHAILRLFGRIFGDDDDRINDDKTQGNHVHEYGKVTSTTPSATRKDIPDIDKD